jgi:hypothetical protein
MNPEEASNGNAAFGDDNLVTLPRPLQPFAQIGA